MRPSTITTNLAGSSPPRRLPASLRSKLAGSFSGAVQAANERRIAPIWRRFVAEGIEPILIKGWSCARLYADPAERHLGDTDICVAPAQLPAAVALLQRCVDEICNVDLHAGVPDLPDRSWDDIFGRAPLVPLAEIEVRVLAPEDHLRLICRHMARHGLNKEKMLRDVDAALRALPETFDWSACLHGEARDTQWVLTTIGAARRRYGSPLADPEIARRATCPRWLVDSLDELWRHGAFKRTWREYLRTPREIPAGLRSRWLNPVRACYHLRCMPSSRAGLWRTLALYAAFRRFPTLAHGPFASLRRGVRVRSAVHSDSELNY